MPKYTFHLSDGNHVQGELDEDIGALKRLLEDRAHPFDGTFVTIAQHLIRVDSIIRVSGVRDSAGGFS